MGQCADCDRAADRFLWDRWLCIHCYERDIKAFNKLLLATPA